MVRWCWVNFQCRGVLLIWVRVGQWPTVLAVGVGVGCLDIFSLPGGSPGRVLHYPPASALALALAEAAALAKNLTFKFFM